MPANPLHGRSAFDLIVIGNLAPVWPFYMGENADMLEVAARGLDRFKAKCPELWNACAATMSPRHIPRVIVDVILSKLS